MLRRSRRLAIAALAVVLALAAAALPPAATAVADDPDWSLDGVDYASIRDAELAASIADAAALALTLDLERVTAEGPTHEEAVEILLAFGWTPEELGLPDLAAERPKAEGGDDPLDARSNTKDKAILIVHGRDNYNMGGFGSMRSYLINTYGFTGGVHRVGYYGGECNVEHRAEHHGSHNAGFGGSGEHTSKSGCVSGTTQVHDLDTDIRHLAYHLAWMVRDHWTASSKPVDVIAHSMGGLMTRYMLAKEDVDGFPALSVEDVTTMGTPHGGLSSWCSLSPWSDVRQMCSGSSFIGWLRTNAQNPQSKLRSTDWTLMMSDGTCDGWVTEGQGLDMTAAHKVVYLSPCYSHSQYYGDTSGASDARVDYQDNGGAWNRWSSAPHSVRWSAHASYYGTW